MTATARDRRDRLRAMLADLKMPGALEAVDGVLAKVDSGAVTAGEAIEQVLGAQIALRNNRRLQAAMRFSRLPAVKTLAQFDFTFQLINARHERASTVLTSNKGFEEWGHVLGDEIMAAALIDRLLHHCHIVNIRGNSYRMREHQHWLRTASDEQREGVAT